MTTTLYEDLRAHLVGSVAAVEGRVSPVYLPQGAPLPALTYQRISDPAEDTLSGRSRLRHPRYQITVWAPTYAMAHEVAEQVADAMAAFGSALVELQPDSYNPETGVHMVPVDAVIWHQR